MKLSLVNLVPLKEVSIQAKALAKQYKLSQLQKMLDQRLGPDQEAASDMPDFDPNKFSNSEDFGPSANDLDAAITIKRGDSGEMTYGDMLHKNYPDKYGPGGVALDKDIFTKSSKFDRMNEAKIKTKEEFDEIASAEQKAMEKKWNSLVTNIALSKSDPKKFTANMEAKQEYLTNLNNAGKLKKGKKGYSDDKIENWSTHDNLPGWKIASTVLKTPKSTNEGSCGHGPNGVPGNTPGGTKGMPADDRTRGMLRMLIQKEVAKLNENENFDDRLKSMMGNDDFQKATNPKLAKLINTAIMSIDPNMSYKEFAKGVAQVLIDDYGVHNYEPFIKELKNALDSTLG